MSARKKYQYWAEWPSGSTMSLSLKALCYRVYRKFSYLHEVDVEALRDENRQWLHNFKITSATNAEYISSNVFARKYDSYTTMLFPIGCPVSGPEYWIIIRRIPI